MKRLVREPLLHFLLLGALIFALNAWRETKQPAEVSAARIEVTTPVIERLRTGFERQFGMFLNRQLDGRSNSHTPTIGLQLYYLICKADYSRCTEIKPKPTMKTKSIPRPPWLRSMLVGAFALALSTASLFAVVK